MAFLLLISFLISFHHSSLGEAEDAERAAFSASPSQQTMNNVEATTESVLLDYTPSKPNPIHSPPGHA